MPPTIDDIVLCSDATYVDALRNMTFTILSHPNVNSRVGGQRYVNMAEESARVAQRCEAGKESKQLLLDSCNLRKFPDAVFFLLREVELQRVSLANNQLQRIPSKLGLRFTSITGDSFSLQFIV